MVIPSGVEFDASYFSVKVNAAHLGIDVSYLSDMSNNGVKEQDYRSKFRHCCNYKEFCSTSDEGVDEITIFVNKSIWTDGESVGFPNDEVLILENL